MKLSEVIEAINNNTFEADATDDMDIVIMVQKVVSDSKMDVRGILKGDDDRMAMMFADRMVKSEGFRKMIAKAVKYSLRYELKKMMEDEESNNETAEE